MAARLDIESLRALEAIGREGGVTRAAEKLARSQSAVSHQIRRLERQLGRALLNRKPDAPLFSRDGVALMAYAQRIVALHDEALAALGRGELSGRIRLGVTEEIACSSLPDALGRFARVEPGVAIDARAEQSVALARLLDDGAIDLAVMQDFEDALRPNDRVLARDALVWAQAVDAAFAEPLPFVAFDEACFYRHWAEKVAAREGLRLRVTLTCPSLGGVVAAAEAGLGATLIARRHLSPRLIVRDDLPTPPGIAYVARARAKGRSVAALMRAIEAAGV